MFQFDLFPRSQPVDNRPFWPPRIIGIEKKHNYAAFDLSLLLILFFHRFMLKSLGLWKSIYEEDLNFPEDKDRFEIVRNESNGEVSLCFLRKNFPVLAFHHLRRSFYFS